MVTEVEFVHPDLVSKNKMSEQKNKTHWTLISSELLQQSHTILWNMALKTRKIEVFWEMFSLLNINREQIVGYIHLCSLWIFFIYKCTEQY